MAYLQSKETEQAVKQKILNLQSKYKNTRLSLTVWDFSVNKKYSILNKGMNSFSSYKIIYDPLFKFKIHQLSDEYYCTNLNDLYLIIEYMLQNSQLYIHTTTDDVLDHPELIKYTDNDTIEGEELDF